MLLRRLCAILFLVIQSVTCFGDWTGTVTDSSGSAIGGVCVSDGLVVVKTDDSGRFSIPERAEARFIFVSTPAGKRTVGPFYQAIEAKKKDYSFQMNNYQASAGETVKFIQISDVETASGQLVWRDNVRDHARLAECAFVVSTGDITYRDGMKFNAENVNDQTMLVPTYYVIGNHDYLADDPAGYREKTYNDLFGPCWYSFNAGPVHFVTLPMPDSGASFPREAVVEWLKNDLAQLDKSTPIVFFEHGDLKGGNRPYTTPGYFVYADRSRQPLDLSAYPVKGWLFGHYHQNTFYQDPKTKIILGTVGPCRFGGLDHSLAGFMVYTMDKNGFVNIDNRTCYSDHHASVMAYQVGGSVRILTHGYDSAADVESASFTIVDQQGDISLSGALNQVSAWTWSAESVPGSEKTFAEKPFSGTVSAVIKFADGRTVEVSGPVTALAPGCDLRWSVNVGGNLMLGEPIVFDGGVIVGTSDDGNRTRCAVVSIDGNGKIRWRTPVENSIRNAVAVDGDRVYASDQAWNVYCFDASTGRELWRQSLGATPSNMVSAPIVRDGVVYSGYSNNLAAFDAQTGEILWRNNSWYSSTTTARPMFCDDKLIVSGNWSGLFAHDPKTGKLLWQFKEVPTRFRTGAPAVITDAAGKQLLVTNSLTSMTTHDPATGEMIQCVSAGRNLQSASAPLIFDDLILVGSADNGLDAYDRNTLKRLWNVKTGSSLAYAPPYNSPVQSGVEATPTRWGRYAVIGGMDGWVYVVEPTAQQGRIVAKINIGAPIEAPVTIVPSAEYSSENTSGTLSTARVYVTDVDGNVYCFEFNPGKFLNE